ncbi:hypothetical protein BTO15_00075 [Polaribacter sejongensis]|uniref:Uncharacterized protein n=1 Tax=Polaribacter sejongensis TaxID=985043 RepID=A0ABM6PV65_9FLAO|nr:hypothetical protein [Polaribacter sejongensis]AUC20605.1 hypothetical protein BTO15_00075 [Polaribacter sejongensis]
MKDKELLNILEKSFIKESDINDDDFKKKISEYYLETKKNTDIYYNENLIIKIAKKSSKNFGINQIYCINKGIIKKTSNKIITGKEANSMWITLNNSDIVNKKKYNKSKKEKFIETSEIRNEVLELKKMVESLNDSVKQIKKENLLVKELLYSNASSYNDSKTTQIIPIDIYLDTNEPQEIFEVYDSVLKFTQSIGFDDSIEFEAIKGSWYKRILAKSKKKLSSDEVKNRLSEAEYGIEVNTILKPQSEIDKNQSEALSNIITSLKDIPNAAIRIGALIVVKLTDEEGSVSLQTRTLSIKELHLLNKKPELLQMPKQILQALAKEIKNDEPPTISRN